jgi:molecular chaperone GrpE
VTEPSAEHLDRPVDGEYGPQKVTVRDKRRIDPESGELREPVAPAPAADPALEPEPANPVADRVAELTEDLQRLSAEYANYRKRVERDRVAVADTAMANVLVGLLPVLDDIERARAHGDLTGGFKGVGESVEALTAKLGLSRFGEVGEPFDPTVHEAVMAAEPDPSSSVATCAQVLQPGYRSAGGRVLRPARVAVAEAGAPAEPAAHTPVDQQL